MNNIVSVTIEERMSKAQKPYYVLVTTFKNGYKFESFLNRDQKMIIELALKER